MTPFRARGPKIWRTTLSTDLCAQHRSAKEAIEQAEAAFDPVEPWRVYRPFSTPAPVRWQLSNAMCEPSALA
jgi:hypothetical protein